MHRLGFRLKLALIIAIAAGAWYDLGKEARAAQSAIAAPVELELPGLALPTSRHGAASARADSRTVLAPSCAMEAQGACARLQAVCDDLQGTMTDNRDGSLTCLIVLQ